MKPHRVTQSLIAAGLATAAITTLTPANLYAVDSATANGSTSFDLAVTGIFGSDAPGFTDDADTGPELPTDAVSFMISRIFTDTDSEVTGTGTGTTTRAMSSSPPEELPALSATTSASASSSPDGTASAGAIQTFEIAMTNMFLDATVTSDHAEAPEPSVWVEFDLFSHSTIASVFIMDPAVDSAHASAALSISGESSGLIFMESADVELPAPDFTLMPFTIRLEPGQTEVLTITTTAKAFASSVTPPSTVVPEPVTATLGALGLATLASATRRRRA